MLGFFFPKQLHRHVIRAGEGGGDIYIFLEIVLIRTALFFTHTSCEEKIADSLRIDDQTDGSYEDHSLDNIILTFIW